MGIRPTVLLSWVGLLMLPQLTIAWTATAEGGNSSEGNLRTLAQIDIDENSRDPEDIIRQAVEAGAIGAELGRSRAIREMYAREGLVIRLNIYPPPGAYRDDYGRLRCRGQDMRALWLFFHWFAHMRLDQRRSETAYDLGKAVAEHAQYADRVYDYDKPPTQPFFSYRYEQQAAILSDFALLRRCGDANDWLPQYERTVKQFLG